MRAAYIDMTDVSNTCPQWLTNAVIDSTRMCTSSHSTAAALQSTSQHMECHTLRSAGEHLHTKEGQMMHFGILRNIASQLSMTSMSMACQ